MTVVIHSFDFDIWFGTLFFLFFFLNPSFVSINRLDFTFRINNDTIFVKDSRLGKKLNDNNFKTVFNKKSFDRLPVFFLYLHSSLIIYFVKLNYFCVALYPFSQIHSQQKQCVNNVWVWLNVIPIHNRNWTGEDSPPLWNDLF